MAVCPTVIFHVVVTYPSCQWDVYIWKPWIGSNKKLSWGNEADESTRRLKSHLKHPSPDGNPCLSSRGLWDSSWPSPSAASDKRLAATSNERVEIKRCFLEATYPLSVFKWFQRSIKWCVIAASRRGNENALSAQTCERCEFTEGQNPGRDLIFKNDRVESHGAAAASTPQFHGSSAEPQLSLCFITSAYFQPYMRSFKLFVL